MHLKPIRRSIIREIISPTIRTGKFALNNCEAVQAVSVLPVGKPITVGSYDFLLYREGDKYTLTVRPYNRASHISSQSEPILSKDRLERRMVYSKSFICDELPDDDKDHDIRPSFEPIHQVYLRYEKRFSNAIARTRKRKKIHSGNYSYRGRNNRYKDVCRESIRKLSVVTSGNC